MFKLSVRVAGDVDHTNAFAVTKDGRTFTVWTNEDGEGLWIDGKQILGTSQFRAGKNPSSKIRKFFEKD